MAKCIFTGTFNPFTIGHADIVARALNIFDKVVIGVGYNPDKDNADCPAASRVDIINNIYAHEPRVMAEAYSDLTIDFAARHGAKAIVKGVRSVKDFEYERDQAEMNMRLVESDSNGEATLDTVLFYSRPELSAVSSSMVRTLQQFGRDVEEFVAAPLPSPPPVEGEGVDRE